MLCVVCKTYSFFQDYTAIKKQEHTNSNNYCFVA